MHPCCRQRSKVFVGQPELDDEDELEELEELEEELEDELDELDEEDELLEEELDDLPELDDELAQVLVQVQVPLQIKQFGLSFGSLGFVGLQV